MKTVLIIAGIVVAGFMVVANEVGNYCQDVNPYAPEDYTRNDTGQDF